MHLYRIAALALAALCCSASPASEQKESEAIFNGKDLSNWEFVNKEDVKMEATWSVADGVLRCTGRPVGYIRTKREDYRDYRLIVEWRWPVEGEEGNNGVLVHATTPGALGVWPKSIEIQLGSGDAGDFWVIGTELDVPDEETRKKGRRHLNLTDDSEKPIGKWNRMVITCRDDKVRVRVNGQLVNAATNCSVSEGAIALQSEGAPIEFRRVEVKRLGR